MRERQSHCFAGLPSVCLAPVHKYACVCSHKRREEAHYGVEQVRMTGNRYKAHHTPGAAVNQTGFACGQILKINCRSGLGSGSDKCLAFNLEGVCRINGLDFKY